MRKYLLDSAPAQAFMHGLSPVKVQAAELSQTGAKIGICMPVFAELMGGIELSQTRERNRKILLKAVRKLYVWPFDRVAAEEYGRIYAYFAVQDDRCLLWTSKLLPSPSPSATARS